MISLEFSLLVVSIVACLMMVSFVGRAYHVSGIVEDVAAESARLASTKQSAVAAESAVTQRVTKQLKEICSNLSVSTDTENFEPGGSVVVQIDCQVSLLGLSLLKIPSQISFRASASEIIDSYRAEEVI